MATKADISAKLTGLGIAHDPKAPVATLQALLPKDEGADTAEVGALGATREARWAAFLAEARKVNPDRFDRQKEAGEFDKIPDQFV